MVARLDKFQCFFSIPSSPNEFETVTMEIFFKHALVYQPIGPAKILRPSQQTRTEIREMAEAHLRSKYEPGTYSDNKTCNEILQHQYAFYEAELNKLLPLIASSRWVGELLFQYDESGKLSKKYKLNKLSKADHALWRSIGAVYRQSIDLMCEKLAALGEIDKLSVLWPTQIPDFERALVCAENCVEYSEVSNYTHIVVPNATTITIHPVNSDLYFEHQINDIVDKLIREYQLQNHKEITERNKYLEKRFAPFDHRYHASILNDPLRETFGITYEQYQGLVTLAPSRFKRPKSFKNIPMCIKADLINGITEETGLPSSSIEFVIDSLVLETTIPREVWNSRQSNRINKQPFLQFDSYGREVLMWSNSKVGDFLALLDSELTFNKPPKGWARPLLKSAVSEISDAAGKWFERSVVSQLELLNAMNSEAKLSLIRFAREIISVDKDRKVVSKFAISLVRSVRCFLFKGSIELKYSTNCSMEVKSCAFLRLCRRVILTNGLLSSENTVSKCSILLNFVFVNLDLFTIFVCSRF